MTGDSRSGLCRYADTRVAPLLHQIIEDVLIARPADPVAFLKQYISENAEILREGVQNTIVQSIACGDEDQLSDDQRELLKRIERLENDKEALKKIGRTEIARLKQELEDKNAYIQMLEESKSLLNAEKESRTKKSSSSYSDAEEKLMTLTGHLSGMHPVVSDHGLTLSHFLGVEMSSLSKENLECLIDAWQGLAADARELLNEDKIKVKPTVVEATTTTSAPLTVILRDRLQQYSDESIGVDDLVSKAITLNEILQSHNLAVLVGGKQKTVIAEELVGALVASDGTQVEMKKIEINLDTDASALIATCKEDGEWIDGILAAHCRAVVSKSQVAKNWVYLQGDISQETSTMLTQLIFVEKEISVAGMEKIPLGNLKFIIEVSDIEIVPDDLRSSVVVLFI